jgi:hypothetical protein
MITRLETCPNCGHVLAPAFAPPAPPAAPPPPAPPVTTYVPVYPAPAAPPPPATSGGLSAASVPKILLGLGATCLLVAAVIFLAVAWSWLGIGGRTAVLVALTATTALAGQWLARRDLGVAAEALTAVALGLLVLDLIGAEDAGWLGQPTFEEFLALVGGTLLAVSLALGVPTRRLVLPQLAAPVGLGLLVLGVGADTVHPQVVTTVSVLLFTGLAVLAHRIRFAVLPWTATVGAAISYSALTGLALTDASDNPTLRGLWAEGHGVGLLTVAALTLLPWLVVRGHDELRQLVCAASVSMLTYSLALPVLDEGATAITLTAAAASLVWAVAAALAPPGWYVVPRVPLVGSLVVLAPVPALLAAQGLAALFSVGEPFSADATVRLSPESPIAHPLLLPLAVAVVCVVVALPLPGERWFRPVAGVAAFATALLTAALYPLPLWAFVAALGPAGIVVSLPSGVLTLVVLGEIVVVAAALLVRRVARFEPVAALVLPVALAAFLWTGGHVTAETFEVRSLVVLMVLGLLALALPRLELEVAAGATVLGVSMLGITAAADPSVSASVHLTLAGAIVTTSALLYRDHRSLAWLGGLLLASATWVRLYDVGVHAPEPYTLPTAVALVLVGLYRLHRDPAAETVPALLPGLSLATVPSLLWALLDPLSTRATLLGLACLAVLLAGTALRWTAPVLVGWIVGGLLVLRELAPYTAQTPQWVLIGAAGTLLIGVGVTWEARLRDLRRAASYLGRLR